MTLATFASIPIQDEGEPLALLVSSGNLKQEPVYFQQGLWQTRQIWLRASVAKKLEAIAVKIFPLGLLVWDGWRSRTCQAAIYNRYRDQIWAFRLGKSHALYGETQPHA